MVVFSKSCKFWQNRWFFVRFLEMSYFLQLFAEKLTKTPKHGCFLEKLQVLAKWMIFRSFSRNEPLFATFCWKAHQNAQAWYFNQEVVSFGQIDDFSCFFTKWLMFPFGFWKSSKRGSIWPKLATFRENYHVSAFWWTFQQKVAKSGSFRQKARKIIDLLKACNFSMKLPCLSVLVNFSAKRCKKWLISWKMTENHRFGLNLQLFEETTMFRRFCQIFSKKLQKVAHFVKNDDRSSIWPKLCNFWNKLPCLCLSMNFSEKSCKKYLVSWNRTKNHRFCQSFATFRTNYHVLAFPWSF